MSKELNVIEPDDFVQNEPEDVDYTEETKPQGEKQVKYGDPEWSDYVMTLFTEDELYKGKHPTLNGLRRVTEKHLGQIITSEAVELKSSLDHTSTGRAYCVYKISINNFLGSRHYRTFTGCGGSYEGNTDPTYAVYPECIAEGRAEARAFRKALMITVVAADEIKGNEKAAFESVINTVQQEDYDENEVLSETQLKVIEKSAKRKGIDVESYLDDYKKKNNKETLTKQDGIEILKFLNETSKK